MLKFFATTSLGIEPALALELERIGATGIEPARGGVHFEGDFALMVRANLWLRTATRVLMPIREFSATGAEMLYSQVRRLHWEDYLDPERTLAVECTIAGVRRMRDDDGPKEFQDAAAPRVSPVRRIPNRRALEQRRPSRDRPMRQNPEEKQGLHHSHYVALKVKDAIVDRLREKYGHRPNVDTKNPDLRIYAYLNGSRCTLGFDSTGGSLHERGYRGTQSTAPMKENLAAALVLLSEWDGTTPFLDPMCGSGTIVIEAAMIAANQAPGLSRDRFGFMGWKNFDKKIWLTELERARGSVKHDCKTPIFGFDRSEKTVMAARGNANQAGVGRIVRFEGRALGDLQPPTETPGVMITNPPYGERAGQSDEMQTLYKNIGDLLKQRFKGWRAFLFTGNLEAAKFVGLRTSRRIPLHNGPIECRLLRYDLY